jgi:hypothetical protein
MLPLLRTPRRHWMLTPRAAPPLPRTSQAQWPTRQAHRRPQFHHPLVKVACALRVHQRSRKRADSGCKSCLCSGPPCYPRQHAFHVAIHHRHRLTERDARHRRRRVSAYSRQCPQSFRRAGHRARPLLHHHLRRTMQHARPPVIAQSAPERQHLRLARCRQRLRRGKCRKEKPVVLQHRGHPRLLQHDLRNPDAIRIARSTPRQVALVRSIPRQQSGAHLLSLVCRALFFGWPGRCGLSGSRHCP